MSAHRRELLVDPKLSSAKLSRVACRQLPSGARSRSHGGARPPPPLPAPSCWGRVSSWPVSARGSPRAGQEEKGFDLLTPLQRPLWRAVSTDRAGCCPQHPLQSHPRSGSWSITSDVSSRQTFSSGRWHERLVVPVPSRRPEQAAGPRGFLWDMGPLGSFPQTNSFPPSCRSPTPSRPHPAPPNLQMG